MAPVAGLLSMAPGTSTQVAPVVDLKHLQHTETH